MRAIIDKHKMTLFIVLNLVFTIGMNLGHPVTPSLLKDMNLPSHVFGVSFAAMSLTNFIFALIWSNLADGMKKTKILMISSIGYGLAQIMFGQAHSQYTIYLARLISGIFAGGFQVGFMSYIVNEAPEEHQARYITISSVIVSVGAALGFFFGGLLGDINVRMTFMVQAGMHVVLGILVYILLAPSEKMEEHLEWSMIKNSNPLKIVKESRYLLKDFLPILLMVTFVTSIGFTFYDQSFNYYIKDIFNFPPSKNGYIKFFIGVVAIVLNYSLIRNAKKKDIFTKGFLKVLIGGMGVLAIVGAAMPSALGFVVVSLIWFAAYTVLLPATQNTVLAYKKTAEEGNKLAGLYNALMMCGKIAGALLTSLVYSWSPIATFYFAGGIFLIAFLMLFIQPKKGA